MFCKECGKELREGSNFCTACGTPVSKEPEIKKEEKKEEFDFSKRYDNKPRNSQNSNGNANSGAYAGAGIAGGASEAKTVKAEGSESKGNGVIMSARNTSILAYLTTLGFIIALIAGDRENAKFHLNQALLVHLFMVLAAVPFIGWLWGIFMIVVWIMGIYNAVNGIDSKLPLIGGIKIFDK